MKQVFTLLCLLVLAWIVPPARAETIHGVVIAVIDGDTVLFKPDHSHPSSRAFLKIRLADIDAPENGQSHGAAATRALVARVLHQQVAIATVATDIYGRTIAHIRVGGREIGTEMVQDGFAWAAARSRHVPELAEAQRQARLAGRGLWEDDAPLPPWVWRRTHPAYRY
ncbi:thermonuclease family protein [Thiobacillus sp.]